MQLLNCGINHWWYFEGIPFRNSNTEKGIVNIEENKKGITHHDRGGLTEEERLICDWPTLVEMVQDECSAVMPHRRSLGEDLQTEQ